MSAPRVRAKNAPVHPKVKAATGGAAAGVVVAAAVEFVLEAAFWNGSLDPEMPGQLRDLIYLAVPSALSFAAGWLKPSSPTNLPPAP